jgi:hypothetical protein
MRLLRVRWYWQRKYWMTEWGSWSLCWINYSIGPLHLMISPRLLPIKGRLLRAVLLITMLAVVSLSYHVGLKQAPRCYSPAHKLDITTLNLPIEGKWL